MSYEKKKQILAKIVHAHESLMSLRHGIRQVESLALPGGKVDPNEVRRMKTSSVVMEAVTVKSLAQLLTAELESPDKAFQKELIAVAHKVLWSDIYEEFDKVNVDDDGIAS